MSNYRLSIIQFPSRRFGFVGSVPRDLAIRHSDNRTLSDVEFTEYASASNPAMIKRARNYIEPVFNTREEAVEFAATSGYATECICIEAALDGEASCCASCFVDGALAAGIPRSVIAGKTKLTDHVSREYVESQCSIETQERLKAKREQDGDV